MIVAEFDIVRITLVETKTNAPLIVHGNRVLSHPIILQGVQAIARWDPKVVETQCDMQRFQLTCIASRDTCQLSMDRLSSVRRPDS